MATLSVIFESKQMVCNGITVEFGETSEGTAAFDALVSSQGDADAHALQWKGSEGEIELQSGNEAITEAKANAYIAAFDAELARLKQAEKDDMMAADAEDMARMIRDEKLAETDWWAMSDRTMTAAQTNYRQALRDLPSSWNPSLQWNEENRCADVIGVEWPTKP